MSPDFDAKELLVKAVFDLPIRSAEIHVDGAWSGTGYMNTNIVNLVIKPLESIGFF